MDSAVVVPACVFGAVILGISALRFRSLDHVDEDRDEHRWEMRRERDIPGSLEFEVEKGPHTEQSDPERAP